VSETLPEPWRTALAQKGIHSMRGLASRAGISPQTAKRLIDGTGSPAVSTVEAVADGVFGGDRGFVWNLIGEEREHEPYEPPPEVALLTARQRRALDELIRAMAESRATSRRSDYIFGAGNPSKGPEPDLSEVLAAKVRSGKVPAADIVWAFDESDEEDYTVQVKAGEVSIRRLMRETLRSVTDPQMLAAARKMSEPPRLGRARDEQDLVSEAPDPEGPEHGA
jgi:hypothetical protein